jgi:hypothetical protein
MLSARRIWAVRLGRVLTLSDREPFGSLRNVLWERNGSHVRRQT